MQILLNKFKRRFAILRQFRRPADYWLLVPLGSFAVIVPLLMRLKLAHVARLLTVEPPPPYNALNENRSIANIAPDSAQLQRLLTCMDALLQVGSPLIQRRCLTRGVTLYYFLQRAGLPVHLHFGVSTVAQPFRAHCWLVYEGAPYAEAEDPETNFTTVYVMGGECQIPQEQETRFPGIAPSTRRQ